MGREEGERRLWEEEQSSNRVMGLGHTWLCLNEYPRRLEGAMN